MDFYQKCTVRLTLKLQSFGSFVRTSSVKYVPPKTVTSGDVRPSQIVPARIYIFKLGTGTADRYAGPTRHLRNEARFCSRTFFTHDRFIFYQSVVVGSIPPHAGYLIMAICPLTMAGLVPLPKRCSHMPVLTNQPRQRVSSRWQGGDLLAEAT